MWKRFTGLTPLLFYSLLATATEYPVSGIAPALLKNANIVIRLEEQSIEMQALDKVQIRHHYVITVLNEEGAAYARLVERYDRFSEIRSIEGTLYDAAGNKVKTLKNKDIEDLSGVSGNLMDDSRIKVHDFFYKTYPYTVDYSVVELKKETMFFPTWVPVWDENVSVEKSNYSFKAPREYLLRYKEFNCDPVLVKEEGDKKTYNWALNNFAAMEIEYASPSWKKITPSVLVAPSRFMIEEYTGNMTDWKELGKFQAALNKGRDELPANIRQKVTELISGASSLPEKTRILYNFLQVNTHYISIQLGIGGWRPFEASYVAQKAYGDCKALTNYMYALLKEAGIRSHYALIKAGENEEDIITDFPSRQFNHALLCVPDGKDTIWLECTSQSQSAGYMGSFTGNRHALLITEDGGVLVSTPTYTLNDNLQARHIEATVDEEATLKAKVMTSYRAIQQDNLQMMINELSRDKVKESLHEQLDLGTYEVNSFDYKEKKSSLPVMEEALDITVSNYATITGKRLFIAPNIMTRSNRKLAPVVQRKYDLEIRLAYQDTDTVEIELPGGYEVEAMPKDVLVKTQFGKYESFTRLHGNKLFYYRHYENYSGRFPATDYDSLVNFYEALYKADRNKVVLVKK